MIFWVFLLLLLVKKWFRVPYEIKEPKILDADDADGIVYSNYDGYWLQYGPDE